MLWESRLTSKSELIGKLEPLETVSFENLNEEQIDTNNSQEIQDTNTDK